MSHSGLSCSSRKRLTYRRGLRRGGVEIEPDVPDRVHAYSSARAVAAAAATRPRGHSMCRSRSGHRGRCRRRRLWGWRARRPPCPEGLLGNIVEPDDLFWAEFREPRELHRIGLCDLCEALSSKRLVRRDCFVCSARACVCARAVV